MPHHIRQKRLCFSSSSSSSTALSSSLSWLFYSHSTIASVGRDAPITIIDTRLYKIITSRSAPRRTVMNDDFDGSPRRLPTKRQCHYYFMNSSMANASHRHQRAKCERSMINICVAFSVFIFFYFYFYIFVDQKTPASPRIVYTYINN